MSAKICPVKKRSILKSWIFLVGLFGSFGALWQLYIVSHYKQNQVQTEAVDLHPEVKVVVTHPTFNCTKTRDPSKPEDILCMKPFTFLKNFKNPCWYDTVNSVNGSVRILKCLPYFHIFGVCKTGTTDFFRRLAFHPQILYNNGLLGKETWFWSWQRYGKTSYNNTTVPLNAFVNLFNAKGIGNTKVSIETGDEYSDFITGHGDPMDFWDHRFWRLIQQNDPDADAPTYLTPDLVRHVQPNIKLIVLLREPSERLYSHYYHGGYGKDADDFHKDVLSSLVMLYQCLDDHSYQACLYGKNLTYTLDAPISGSLYSIHLQEWFRAFPREQVLVIRNEDYAKDMQYTLLKTFRFLNVSDIQKRYLKYIAEVPHMYESRRKKVAGSMHNKTRQLLTSFFKEHNRNLAKLLNNEAFLWNDYIHVDVKPKRSLRELQQWHTKEQKKDHPIKKVEKENKYGVVKRVESESDIHMKKRLRAYKHLSAAGKMGNMTRNRRRTSHPSPSPSAEWSRHKTVRNRLPITIETRNSRKGRQINQYEINSG